MSRLVNVVSKMIYLAKILKTEVNQGKTASARRLLELIQRVDKELLENLEKESGSRDFQNDIIQLHQEVVDLDLNTLPQNKTIEILDKIIALGNRDLSIVKENEGLSEEILQTIDPYIQDIVQEINKLSFVKKTQHSCSGHPEEYFWHAYITIIYDFNSKTAHLIPLFHKEFGKYFDKTRVYRIENGTISYESKNLMAIEELIKENKKGICAYDIEPISNLTLKFLKENKIPFGLIPGTDDEYWIDNKDFWKPQFRKYVKRNLKTMEKQIVKRWSQISLVVKKYRDKNTLQYQKDSFFKKAISLLKSGRPKVKIDEAE